MAIVLSGLGVAGSAASNYSSTPFLPSLNHSVITHLIVLNNHQGNILYPHNIVFYIHFRYITL